MSDNSTVILERTKSTGIAIVLQGFAFLTAVHFLPWLLIKPMLNSFFPQVPQKLTSMLTSTAISPIITSCYLYLRTRSTPQIIRKGETLYAALAGIVGIWLITFILSLIIGEMALFSEDLFQNTSQYKFIFIFLTIVWVPLIEEILFRGYFLEILRSNWNGTGALIVSSLLFTLPHLIYPSIISGGVNGAIIGIALLFESFVFGMAYMRGGLMASFLVHAFTNFYQ